MTIEEVKEILKKQGYRIATNITLRTLKKDDLIEKIRILENNWASAVERCENQYNLLNETVGKSDKYRWHDLRKNPEDLPNEGDDCILISVKFRGIECWTVCNYEEGLFYDGMNPPILYNKSIMAWRYIEPFEEVE